MYERRLLLYRFLPIDQTHSVAIDCPTRPMRQAELAQSVCHDELEETLSKSKSEIDLSAKLRERREFDVCHSSNIDRKVQTFERANHQQHQYHLQFFFKKKNRRLFNNYFKKIKISNNSLPVVASS